MGHIVNMLYILLALARKCANGRGYVRLLAYDVEAESKLIDSYGAHERMDV